MSEGIDSLVFLDIDGVLNCNQCANFAWETLSVDKCGHIGVLDYITKRHNSAVVLSSTWRLWDAPRKTVINILNDHNIPYWGSTKDLEGFRGDEIAQWLIDNKSSWRPFVILDDYNNMTIVSNRLVQTNMKSGLSPVHLPKVYSLLKEQGWEA